MRAATRMLQVLLFCAVSSGCRTYEAFHARYRSVDYVVTPALFAEAPQRVAILPFASRGVEDKIDMKARENRRAFYQEFSVRDFEDLEMWKIDQVLTNVSVEGNGKLGMAGTVLKWVKAVDAVGMTSVFDLKALISRDPVGTTDFKGVFDTARDRLQVDACVAGMSRGYGRIYAVVFSTMGMSTRVEMRSSRTGQLLWRGQCSTRSYEIPLTLNPLDVPSALYYTWRNSNGTAMNALTFDAYRQLIATIPYVEQPVTVHVKIAGDAPYFSRPTIWMFLREGVVPTETLATFLMEESGWIKCGLPDGRDVWVLKSDGVLEDDHGGRNFTGRDVGI